MNLFEKEEQTAPQRLQKEMEQALMAFMKDDVGLHLFEVPTGQGKTEVATNVIAKMLRDWMEKGTPMRRIFFITPQNKQLPMDRLLSKLPKEAHPYVIQLKANVDCLNPLYPKDPAYIGKIYPDYEAQIYRLFGKQKNVYDKMMIKLKYFRVQKQLLMPREYQEIAKEEYQQIRKQEREFRRVLREALNDDEDVQKAIESGTIRELFSRPKYRWIPLLYPQTFIRDVKVVFMSARKLLGSTSPILGEPDAMLNQLDGGILIIDECDSVKVDWQNYILETAIENQGRDYVQLFKEISSHLRSLQAPLLPLFEQGQDADSLPWRVQQAIRKAGKWTEWNRLKALGLEIEKKYHTNYAFKQEVKDQDNRIQAIINSQSYITLQNSQTRAGKEGKWQWLLGEINKNKRNFKLELADPRELEKRGLDYVEIFNMLTELNHFTARFFDLIYNAGAAYAELFNEQLEKRYQGDADAQKDMSALNPSNGVNTILNAMGFSEDSIKFFDDMIKPLVIYRKRKKRETTLYPRYSIYTHGFKIFFIKDTKNNCENSGIQLLAVPDTPERILFNTVQQTNVIGMSATATLKTVRSNFNLDFLQDSLPEDMYHEIPGKTKQRMKELIQEIYHKYDTKEINIDVTILPANGFSYHPEEPDKEQRYLLYMPYLDGKQELAKKLVRQIDKTLMTAAVPEKQEAFLRDRYMNVAIALYHFYKNEQLQSMLHFEMKLPDNSYEFSQDALVQLNETILDFLRDSSPERKSRMGLWFDGSHPEMYPKRGTKSERKSKWAGSLIVLQTSNYEEQSAIIEQRLAKGYRLVILTSYGTATSGINITYPLPDKRKNEMKPGGPIVSLVPEPIYKEGEKRDERYHRMSVSAISLGSITYALPQIDGSLRSPQNDKALLEKTVLVESLLYQGAISSEEGRQSLKTMYWKKIGCQDGKYTWDNRIRNTLDVRRHHNQILEQACGRLGRTFLKDTEIKVFINKSNLDRADMTLWDDTNPANTRILTPVIKAIFQANQNSNASSALSDEAKNWQNQSQIKAGYAYHRIEGKTGLIDQVYKKHDRISIKEYKKIRDYLIHHPVLTKEEAKTCPYRWLYLELPDNQHGYSYKEYNIAFFEERYDLWTGGQPEPKDREEGGKPKTRFCSYETSSLPRLLKIKGVQEYMEERGIPITWPKGSCFMTPSAHYIYEGMIGEIVGQFVLKDVFHVEVQDIPELEKTERFDFFIPLPNNRRIYIDIKNWADAVGTLEQGDFLEKNQQKLSEVNKGTGDNKACILNIMPTDEAGVTEETNVQIHLGGQLLIISRLFMTNGQLDPAAGKAFSTLLLEQGAI